METYEPKEENTKTKDKGNPLDALPFDNEDKVSPSYVPEGFESVDAFLEDLREEYDADINYDHDNREEALDDKRFTAGDQWDPAVLAHRENLPNLVINNIPQFTAQLVGDWREERPAIKVVPSENGDANVAEIRSDLIRAIEMKSRASRVYDNGFESAVQCGDGAWRVSVEYLRDDVFDQEICIRAIDDALSVVWDRLSVEPTGRDARHVFVDDLLPEKEFTRKWPEADPSTLGDSTRNSLRNQGWIEDDFVRVTEYWRMIERDRLLVMFNDGSVHYIDEDTDLDELILAKGPPLRSRIGKCLYAQMHLVTGHAILAGPYEYKLNRVPIIRVTGRVVNVGGKRVRFGLVRFMKDPARLKNFWRSTAAEQLGYAPKAKWIAPESAVEGRENEFRKASLSRDQLLIYNDGAESPPQLIPPPPIEAALLNEAQTNAQDMKDVTGIHDASLGIRSNETSGKAIQFRQREGDIASLTYYDNGNSSVLETGDVVNQLISQVYDGTRIIRQVGEDQTIKFKTINDPNDPESPDLSIGNYDVALQTGPSYTTRRVQAADAMMQAVQVWPEIMQIAGDLVVKAQDWPGASDLAERFKKVIPPQYLDPDEREEIGANLPTPEQMQQIMQQVELMSQELQKLQSENEALKNDKQIDFLKVKIDEYDAITQRIRALSDHLVDDNSQALQAIQILLNSNPVKPETSSQGSTSRSPSGNSQ